MMVSQSKASLVFAINGERFDLPNCDPSTTLLEFLRCSTAFKSPKLACGEGGCGACVVLLSKYDPVLGKVENLLVCSCLTLLCSIRGCAITTAEGIGNSKTGFHPIHERFADFHASQCGFCTPGMCMSLFGALANASEMKSLSASALEKSIAGNLCRCTGYRPIADACKSFAADVDIEDLGFGLDKFIPKFPQFLKEGASALSLSSWRLENEEHSWLRPGSLSELRSLIASDRRIKFVGGNTGIGYKTEHRRYDVYVDVSLLPQMSTITEDDEGLIIGASVTISRAINALRDEVDAKYSTENKMVFRKLALHMEKVANEAVRNTGTVGGNIMMAQQKYFPSDIATLLLALNSLVIILTNGDHQTLTLEEFLEMSPMDSRSVLVSIKILFQRHDTNVLFDTYRASPRPLGNALSYLNAAFMAEVWSTNAYSVGCSVLRKCRLAFGAYGTRRSARAKKLEEFLTGKMLTVDLLYEAINILKASVVLEGLSPYRRSLAVGFLFEFLFPLVERSYSSHTIGYDSAALGLQKLLLPSTQIFQRKKEHFPVGEPLKKSGAALQASGEAVFVDDIPSPANCLHGAFIYSTRPLARVKHIGFRSKSWPRGVSAVISFKDIPENGENVGSKTIFGTGTLFADDVTRYAGERLALVVADSQKNADAASSLAVVDYDEEGLEPAILTLDEAVKRSSFFEVPSFISPEGFGDVPRGMAEADHRTFGSEIQLGSQYYFYLENQTAMAVPDEDNCIVVHSSSQCPESTHAVIAKCLGVPEHNVRVITRRVGGGFGGKAIQSMPVATACALAGHKLRRPVRMYLNRKTDMIMAGGRHPMKVTYDVGFKSTGKITALDLTILINAGIFPDVSPVLPKNIVGPLKKYHWGALSFDIKVCKTNHSSKSAMRAPGEVQGSFIADAVIEHVASFLSMDVDTVRTINLHSYDSLKICYGISSGEPSEYTLPLMWSNVAASSRLEERRAKIEEYNRHNLWKKRGISRVPIIHEVLVRPTPGKVSILGDGSIAVEVGGIELGQGLWTKAKQMAAFALRSIACEADLLEKIRVIQSDTLSMIQGGFTAGSTTSESSCEAVRLCCDVLVQRLAPLKKRLEEQSGCVPWRKLISTAHAEAVNMSASSYFVPDYSSAGYLNYGAAVSEVEINLLTGETTMLRSDVVYDCGQSLNPAVDMGQIEGAFVQGVGFFMMEEYATNPDGLVISDSTWSYKIPTVDTVPRQLNVEILSSGRHQKRVLSSKASGEPPLLLAGSVHAAAAAAARAAQDQLSAWGCSHPPAAALEVPATMAAVKERCGLEIVERYLEHRIRGKLAASLIG